jgi:Lon protease-like protein
VRRAGPADAAGGAAQEAFFPSGTLARIEELHRPQSGLILVRCRGAERFRVQRSAQQRYGLWVGDVELQPPDAAVTVPADLAHARVSLQDLARNIEHSIAHSGEPGVESPLSAPYRWDDCGWLANRWCEMLPLGADVKNRLMALDSPVLRLELVADQLAQMGWAAPR